MARSDTTFIVAGGGEISEAEGILDVIFENVEKVSDPKMVVMTVATDLAEEAKEKYGKMFRRGKVKHVSTIDVSDREEAYQKDSIKKLSEADAIFFTGGDQTYITALMGGSPLDKILKDKVKEGVVVIGTSAGATMMSGSMIAGGEGSMAPRVGGVKMSPGMNLIPDTIIDTHFSQRGRHGRILTAIAHDPQLLGLGIDERTAFVLKGRRFKVVGDGSVTVFDGSNMSHTDLVERRENDPVSMFDVCIHVLHAGYSYDMVEKRPLAARRRAS